MMYKILLFIFSVLLFWCLSESYASKSCPIDYHCNDTLIKEDDKVGIYCEDTYKTEMTGRCCIMNNTIIGLDLRYCDVKILNISQTAFSNVQILDLRDNDYHKLTADELLGLLKLNYLYLVPIPCPGGNTAWNDTEYTKTETYCSQQIDYCESLKHMNISCGTGMNAKCVRLGPGSAKCDCQSGYFGYKCMQQDTFPTTAFSVGVIIPTIVLSIMLWFIQGRDPYRYRSVAVN